MVSKFGIGMRDKSVGAWGSVAWTVVVSCVEPYLGVCLSLGWWARASMRGLAERKALTSGVAAAERVLEVPLSTSGTLESGSGRVCRHGHFRQEGRGIRQVVQRRWFGIIVVA